MCRQRGGRRAARGGRFWTTSPQTHRVRLQRLATTGTPLEAVVVLGVAVEAIVGGGGLVVDRVLWWGNLQGISTAGCRVHGGAWRAARGGRGFFAVVEVAVVLLRSMGCIRVVEQVSVFAVVAALADAVEREEGYGGDDEDDEGDGDGDDCGG